MYGSWHHTTYAEVSWHPDPVPLPPHIVKRFDGKVMAIVGLETQIVRNVSSTREELAPAFELYNHREPPSPPSQALCTRTHRASRESNLAGRYAALLPCRLHRPHDRQRHEARRVA